jgi:hypothetical protein
MPEPYAVKGWPLTHWVNAPFEIRHNRSPLDFAHAQIFNLHSHRRELLEGLSKAGAHLIASSQPARRRIHLYVFGKLLHEAVQIMPVE